MDNSKSIKSILVLTSTFPRWVNDTDPPFVMELSRRLVKENIKVDILAPHAEGAEQKEIMHGMTVYRYRYFFGKWEQLAYAGGILANLKKNKFLYFLVPLLLISQTISIIKLINKNNYDLIHAHWLIPQGLLAVLVSRMFNKKYPKILCTSHGGDLFAFQSSLFLNVKKYILNHCDGVTVVSNYMRDICLQIINIDEKLHVCPMGVDLVSTFKLVEKTERDDKTILFVGRLVEKKGVFVLLDAIKILIQEYPDIGLLIVGDGPERDKLEERCEVLNITDSVKFKGALNQEQLPKIYSQATMAVIPSIIDSSNDQEGLGLVAIEAMGCGAAVIISALPAVRDIVEDGVNGILVQPGDAKDLAEAIRNLLVDKKTRDMIASRARQSVIEKFDWQVTVKKYLTVIESICE
jgi:glycosyltransferase involved in cell wall biosynthesis